MWFLLLIEVVAAFIVACSDAVGDDHHTARERVFRAVFWPATLWIWFTRRNLPKLARFGAVVWLLLTAGWLLSLEYDRLPTALSFALVAEATLAFVVYVVDAMSPDVQHHPMRRLLRSVFWFKPITGYLRENDSIRLIQASVTVWGLLTSCWLLTLLIDRVAEPLGWMRV